MRTRRGNSLPFLFPIYGAQAPEYVLRPCPIALSGAAIWFLMNLESSMRREAVLADLHELRSIAHVVDMHQLAKDPTTMPEGQIETPHSEKHHLSEFELMRYLDCCSEMLSLTGKLAALYMQNMRDPVIIQAVNEIEELTGNLSRKIWQKIMVLHQQSANARAQGLTLIAGRAGT